MFYWDQHFWLNFMLITLRAGKPLEVSSWNIHSIGKAILSCMATPWFKWITKVKWQGNLVQEIIPNFTQLEVSRRCVVDMERRRDMGRRKEGRNKWKFRLGVLVDSGGIGSYWRSLRELDYQQNWKKKSQQWVLKEIWLCFRDFLSQEN